MVIRPGAALFIASRVKTGRAISHKPQYGMVDRLDEASLEVGDAVTVRRARDDCCARPTGADPPSAGRRG